MFPSFYAHPNHDRDCRKFSVHNNGCSIFEDPHTHQNTQHRTHQRKLSDSVVSGYHIQNRGYTSATMMMNQPSFFNNFDPKESVHDYGVCHKIAEDKWIDFNQLHYSAPNSNDSGVSKTYHLEEAADNLLALLQREASHYSLPHSLRYYPAEFDESEVEVNNDIDASSKSNKAKLSTIGPWRKRIASWMFDVVDHFKYDRNVVSIALRYIDQYVCHLLTSKDASDVGGSGTVVKRRHFQLVAVTSLYLAIKIHGELIEDPSEGCGPHDIISSLLIEVDGYSLKRYVHTEEEDEISNESDEDIRSLSSKIKDLRRRHRSGRQLRLPRSIAASNTDVSSLSSKILHPIPFKPRKRGMLSGPLRLNSFVELSRGLFTSHDITETESKILKALNYLVNPPTCRRYVGEFIRILGFCSTTIDERSIDAGFGKTFSTGAMAASKLGIDRREILQAILSSASQLTESAASIPSLSLGCLPCVLAYAAFLNATDYVFNTHLQKKNQQKKQGRKVEYMILDRDDKPIDFYELEDFQRQYRRFSRSQSAPIYRQQNYCSSGMRSEQYLEAWKDSFLVTVFQASNCYLDPEMEDFIRVRELLMEELELRSPSDTELCSTTSSITEEKSAPEVVITTKKRSPRSPRSVIGITTTRFRRSTSFFSRSDGSIESNAFSPTYDARRSFSTVTKAENSLTSMSFISHDSSAFSLGHSKRPYFKQMSDPSRLFSSTLTQHFRAQAATPNI